MAAALAVLVLYLIKLDEANARIEEQERQLEEQRELIEKKETFGAAMEGLMDTASEFDGVLLTSLVPINTYESFVERARSHRWDPTALDRDTASVRIAARDLETVLSTAAEESTANSTGTEYEATIDQLGGGFVASLIDNADNLCEEDVLACVISDDPYTVHFDATDTSLPYMTDWLRTGLAYHEFAHVLQFANPVPTEIALDSFGGDEETMADCFALTYLDGWTLDHRVWTSSYEYWDVSIGYGHTCNGRQEQAVRDWHEQLGFEYRSVSQR